MPKVTFETDGLILEVTDGAAIPDIVDQSEVSLPFGCRMGSCGTCRCIITEGMQNLNPMTKEEEELFATFTHVSKNERLGCQLKILGDVKIKH